MSANLPGLSTSASRPGGGTRMVACACSLLIFAAMAAHAQTWTFNGHTYQLTSAQMDWQTAHAEAVAAGGYLVAIGSQAEQDFIVTTILPAAGLTVRPAWIGLNDVDQEAAFRWSNGEPVRFSNWHAGEPNNAAGTEDFGAINWHKAHDGSNASGTWADTPLHGTNIGGNTNGPYYGIIEIGTPEYGTSTVTTWNGGNGSWGDNSKWSNGIAPTGASAEVIIDAQPGTNSLVTIDNGFNGGHGPIVGRLHIGAGDQVDLPLHSRLRSDTSAGFPNAGEWRIDGLLTALAPTGGALEGTRTITGTGKIMLGNATDRPEIYGTTRNYATIEGAAAFGRHNNDNFWHQIHNYGLINANIPGNAMYFHTFAEPTFSTNANLMQATNGGILHIVQGAWDNTGGTMLASGPNSIVQFGTSHFADIKGGTVKSENGGLLRVGSSRWRDLISLGETRIDSHGVLHFGGTVTNNGTIRIGPTGGRIDSFYHPTDRVTIAGSGEIILDKNVDRGDSGFGDVFGRWKIEGQTIRGRGTIGRNNGDGQDIINRGTFQADVNGQTLHMDIIHLDNQSGGFLRAKDGGNLVLSIGGPLKNTGGTIEALNGGGIYAGFARIQGGLVRNVGGYIELNNMVLVNPDADQTLEYPTGGMTLRGQLDLTNGRTVRLVNTIRNEGELRVRSTGSETIVRIGETGTPHATLTGGGTITLGDPSNTSLGSGIFEGDGGFTLTNKDNLIRGFGQVGEAYYRRMQLVNDGTISADASGKQLYVHTNSLDNRQGELRAESGGILNLTVNTPIRNEGSVIEAGANSKVWFNWFTEVSGGTLKSASNATFDLSHATLRNPGTGMTLEGPFEINTNNPARLVGEITNKGTINILDSNTYTRLLIGRQGEPNVTLKGGGEIVLKDATLNEDEGRVHQGADNVVLTLEDQTLRGYGLVGYMHGGYRSLSIVNNSSIIANDNAKVLQLSLVGLTNSPGKLITAANGSSLVLDANQITNTGATILADRGSDVIFGGDGNWRRINGGAVESAAKTDSSAGGFLFLEEGLRAEGGVVFNNRHFAYMGHPWAGRTFNGLENGGGQFINSGTVRKRYGTEYWLSAPLTHTGTFSTEGGVLRLFGGGTITNGKFTTAANSWTGPTNTSAPYTFHGANNVMDGAGNFFNDNSPIVLADTATQISATNFHVFGPGSVTGPGTMTFSNRLAFEPYSSATISGTKLVQLPSATGFAQTYNKVNLLNGAEFENQGAFSITGDTIFEGSGGAQITNSGTLVNASFNELRLPLLNTGHVQVNSRRLWMKGGGAFVDATMDVTAQGEAVWSGGTLLLGGENTITGAGISYIDSAAVTFGMDAKLTAGNFTFYGNSSVSGDGELNALKDLRFLGYNFNTTISESTVRVAEGGYSLMEIYGGTLRFDSGALFENSGTVDVTANPTITGDGTGLWSVLPTGNIRFSGSNKHLDVRFVNQGQMTLASHIEVKLDKGGDFHAGSKLVSTTNDMSALWRFTGNAPFNFHEKPEGSTDALSHQFAGPGIVLMENATFNFLDPGVPAREVSIVSNHRLHMIGSNVINGRGTIEVNTNYGTNSGMLFQDGSVKHALTLDGVTLINSSPGGAIWQSDAGSINLVNGAQFVNNARFSITSAIGTFAAESGSRFHNGADGTLVHYANRTNYFDIPVFNEGLVETAAGLLNFRRGISGPGGIKTSNGAKTDLLISDFANSPQRFLAFGDGSQTLAYYDVETGALIFIKELSALSGGLTRLVGPDGASIVAAGGGNIVAAGGGNIVAAGGLNLIGMDGASILSHNGGQITAVGFAANAASFTADAGRISAETAAGIRATNTAELVAKNSGEFFSKGNISVDAGASLTATANGLVKTDGAPIVAAGAGNIVAAGGGNIVAAGGGNVLARGGAPVADHWDALLSRAGAEIGEAMPQSAATTGGTITSDTGGVIKAEAGGQIIAEFGGLLRGRGTFDGVGRIQNGGTLAPGMSPGILTWNGNVTVEPGGTLEIEIAGSVAGTGYDRLKVTNGAVALNGNLVIKVLDGFDASISPQHVFDVVTASGGIGGTLPTRASVAGSLGSFAVSVVNGNTLRLTDYQPRGLRFNDWAAQRGLTGDMAAMTADPDGDGLSNLLEYAFGSDPTGGGASPTKAGTVEANGGRYLSLSFTRPTGDATAFEVLYVGERATSLNPAAWSDEGVVVHSMVPGPGQDRETVTIRSTTPVTQQNREFMRVSVELAPVPPPPPQGLSILEARYGADTRQNDVKSIIEANIADDAVNMPVNNSTMGGDPAPGVVKQLFVRYTFAGTESTKTVSEGGTLTLP